MAKTVKIPLKEIAEKAANKEISGYKVAVKPAIQYEGGDGIKISFRGNSQLTSLSFTSAFNGAIPNIKDMSSMFSSCSALTSLDLSSFDTSKVTNMNSMFEYCSSLKSLDLSSFDTSKVTNMGYMFFSCSALTSLDLSSFDTSKVTNMNSMFEYCSSLKSLDLSSFDTSNVTNMNDMFFSCTKLTSLRFPSSKSFDISSTALVHDALVVLLNDLKSVTTTQTLTMGSSKLALLSDAEKKIATDKGWTLA